jgi:hypothetical protein
VPTLPNRWLTLSLLIGALLAATPPPRDGGLAFFILVGLLVVSLRFDIGPLALVGLFVVGAELRTFSFGAGVSDVGAVTRAAIDLVLHGGNPYGIGYAVTNPPGAPFAYGPLTLLWYLPAADPRVLEMLVSGLIVAILAVRGRPLGLAIWATAPVFVQLASDGSNDTSAGLLLLIGLVVLERLPRAGAFLVGLAAAFKPYALAWLPPIAVWAGVGALASGIVGAAVLWLPAIIMWGAGSIAHSFQLSDSTKGTPYYSLGEVLALLGLSPRQDLLDTYRLVAGGLTAVIASVFARSHGAVVVAGTLIFIVTLYAGFWSTAAYLAAIGPVLCWYADVWLAPLAGRGDDDLDPTRIAWPTDPIGSLIDEVDRRWPVPAHA